MTNKTEITERLKKFRVEEDLTTKAFAKFIGVDYQTYDYWELGLRKPVKAVYRLIDVLHLMRTLHPDTFQMYKKSVIGK